MKAPILHIIRGLPEGFSEGLPYSYYMDVVRGEWSFAFRVHGFGVYSGQVAPGSILFKVYTTFGCRVSVELICVTRSDTFWGGAGAPPDRPTQGLQKPFIKEYSKLCEYPS